MKLVLFYTLMENSFQKILHEDNDLVDRISSYNNIYINNHSPFAGDHMLL